MQRQSNFELLRILCMWGVLTAHVLQTLYQLNSQEFSVANEFRVLLLNSSIIAVNCFVLISGYFRIKTQWSSFFNLYTQCAFYAVGFAILAAISGTERGILRSVFALSESNLWFVKTYFGLFLFAPILNTAFEFFSKNQRFQVLLLLGIIDIYLGYIHQIEEISTNGYNLIHFICLYYAGAYISEMPATSHNNHYGKLWLIIVILMTVMYAIKMVFPEIAVIYSLRYNSPMVLLASVVFFMWARTWRIQSSIVNWSAASVFSVYLIHSNPYVWGRFMAFLKDIQMHYSIWETPLLISAAMFMLYVSCIVLDKIRIIVCSPIVKKLTEYSTYISAYFR